MPSIEGGGVEKNLFIITNYLSKKFNYVSLITASKEFKHKFKKVEFVTPGLNLSNFGRKIKYLFCLYELIKVNYMKRENNNIILSSKCLLYFNCKIFKSKIIVRSNSSPSGWSNNFLKKNYLN